MKGLSVSIRAVWKYSLILLSGLWILSCNPSPDKNRPTSTSGTKSMDSARNLNVTKFNGNPMKQQSAQYLMKVYSNNLYAIKSSKAVKGVSSDKEVQQLAGFLMNVHTKLNKEIENIAAKEKISLPGDLTNEQEYKLGTLNQEKGLDYEEEYLREMVNIHKNTLNLLKQAKQSSDPLILSWSKKTLPKIEDYIDKITTRQARIDSLQFKTNQR